MADETQTVDLASISFPTDPSKLPTTKEVPLGTLEFEIKGWQAYRTKPQTDPEQIAKGNRGNKLAFKVQLSITAPEAFRGFPHTHDFYIGSNDDPDARKESTWRSNGPFMMKLLKEAGVSLSATTKPVEALQASIGQRVGGEVKLEKDRTGKYPDKHVIRSWFRAGTKPYLTVVDGGAPSTEPPAGVSMTD